jgi:hypothetical protein
MSINDDGGPEMALIPPIARQRPGEAEALLDERVVL